MARIYQRQGQSGRIWYLDYSLGGRRIRKRLGKSKKLAELAKADVEVKLERSEIGFANKDVGLKEFIGEYLNYSKANKSANTFDRDRRTLKTFYEFVKAERLTAVTVTKIEAYKTFRQNAGAKPATVNRELNSIKAMLTKAVAWGYLAKSPAQSVKKFKEPKRQVRYFTKEEIQKLVENAQSPRLAAIVQILAYTGLRRSELVHLTWDDLDFKKKLLVVQAKNGWQPKDYEVRHIPLNDRLLRVLREVTRNGSPYIFPNISGATLIGNLLSRDFRRLAKRCGLKNTSIHSLRHSFASHLVMQGVNLYTVQKLLGHSSIKTTEIYAHLAPNYLSSAVSKLTF
ncbi:MAG: tyrosine-type recombinase/integrase [Elusimicrobia bacterium]|nr:tyrosine-type recombinase/integrase [Elusimicrobiota bacterium]